MCHTYLGYILSILFFFGRGGNFKHAQSEAKREKRKGITKATTTIMKTQAVILVTHYAGTHTFIIELSAM